VYILHRGGYTQTRVNAICDDCLDTDEDILFYDDIGVTWVLCESTARKITQKSQ
jgi:hypothetical protein